MRKYLASYACEMAELINELPPVGPWHRMSPENVNADLHCHSDFSTHANKHMKQNFATSSNCGTIFCVTSIVPPGRNSLIII